jgi:hypothetical protein
MEEPEQEAGSPPEPEKQHHGISKLLRGLPHVLTVLIGIIALGDLLKEFGRDTNKMIENIISQLRAASPFEPAPGIDVTDIYRQVETNHPFMDWVTSVLLHTLGISPALHMLRGGPVGIAILAGVLGPALAVTLQASRKNPLYLFGLGFCLSLYCIILKYVLIAILTVFGAFLSLTTAFVCMLAGVFLGLKVLAAPLEVYHGARSVKELADNLKGK